MISWVAMERIVRRHGTPEGKLRMQANGRPMRADADPLTDEELLAKLRSFGVEIDRPSLEDLCARALSAEQIVSQFLKPAPRSRSADAESDWIWICLLALWQRWFPDQPSFESLDDKMQTGYELLSSGGAVAACPAWLDAWKDVLLILDDTDIQTIREFDEQFCGTQSLFNWIQDLECELWNAGLDDRQFLHARIAMCEEALRRFPTGERLMIENWRRAMAETYFELGDPGETDSRFREWLAADPTWGWGWIGWSDRYQFSRTQKKDLQRAEEILRQGLAVPDVRDRADIAERLAVLCREEGRGEEAAEFQKEAGRRTAPVDASRKSSAAGNVLRQTDEVNFGDHERPLGELSNVAGMTRGIAPTASISSQKVGRNEPCPCGSGKKYKKCCGK